MKRLVKLLLSLLVWIWDSACSTIRRAFRLPTPPRAVILYYHAVKPNQRSGFARQMDLLLKVAKPCCLSRLPSNASGRYAAVTFDDGFISVVENAMPELKRRGIPFTVFCPTGSWNSRPSWLKGPQHSSWSERVMSQDELRELAKEPLVTIGSHSISHPNFCTLDPATAAREFGESKRELEQVLGKAVELFSFPHGAHDAQLVQQGLSIGYRRLFTVAPTVVDPSNSAALLGRVATEPDDWPMEFFLKLHGAYRWLARSVYRA